MIQPRGQLNLSKKALAAERFGEIGMQHFDRDFPIVLDVAGQVDGGHPARAELTVEAIAIGERFDQCNGGVHAARVSGSRSPPARCRRAPREARADHAAVSSQLRKSSLTPSHTHSASGLIRWLRGRFRHITTRLRLVVNGHESLPPSQIHAEIINALTPGPRPHGDCPHVRIRVQGEERGHSEDRVTTSE